MLQISPGSRLDQPGCHQLFATPVWVFDHPDAAALNSRLRSLVEAEMRDEPSCDPRRLRSVRQGWKGRPMSFLSESWLGLGQFIADAARQILVEGLPIAIESPGVNVHFGQGYNVSHVHSHCLLSGVYYIAVPSGAGELVLEDPRVQAVFASDYGRYRGSVLGAPRFSVSPREGLLVLFPSWLSHRVDANASDDLRISLPVNVLIAPAPPPSGTAAPSDRGGTARRLPRAGDGVSKGFGAR